MLNDTHEPYNEMHSAISSYTTAQVAPSDGIGFSNSSLINMACRTDGLLLQPSAPARAIDASFALSGGPQNKVRNVHAVMATHSLLSVNDIKAQISSAIKPGAQQRKWTHVLTIGLNKSFGLLPYHLGDDLADGPALAWTGYQATAKQAANVTLLGAFSSTSPLMLPPCGYSDFRLYHVAPILPQSKLAFLGELGKWVPTAPGTRVQNVADSADGVAVRFAGVPGEAVRLAFAGTPQVGVVSVLCEVGANGLAQAVFDGKTAKC